MFTPRFDIYFDINLVDLNKYYLSFEYENSLLEEYLAPEEKVKTNSQTPDELKEILQKVEEMQ